MKFTFSTNIEKAAAECYFMKILSTRGAAFLETDCITVVFVCTTRSWMKWNNSKIGGTREGFSDIVTLFTDSYYLQA